MKKILVLEGGFNEEHEVSLRTSKEVQKSLKRMKLKFEVLKVNPKNFNIQCCLRSVFHQINSMVYVFGVFFITLKLIIT